MSMKTVMFLFVLLLFVAIAGPVWATDRIFVFTMSGGTTKVGWSEAEAHKFAITNQKSIRMFQRCTLQKVELRTKHSFVKPRAK